MRVLFVAQNLQIGGIQTALINTLKEIDKSKKFDTVDLFLFGDGELISDIPENINIIRGGRLLRLVATPFSKVIESRNILNIILRTLLMLIVRIIGSDRLYTTLFKFQKKLNRYDISISYFNDVPNNYFNRGTNKFVIEEVQANKKLAWIHTDPIIANFNKEYCKKIYKDFDKIVCVSNACRNKFNEFIPEYKDKTYVVYNVFPIDDINKKAEEYKIINDSNLINIVTVSRVENNYKRIDRIIEVCNMLKEESIKNYKWTIVGEGLDLHENKLKVLELGLDGFVEFVGNKKNPYPYIKNKDLFVLTSAFEGYPMVVGEALILKVPVITTAYAAASEQIINDYNGLIVDMDIDDIYMKIRWLLQNKNEIERLKHNLNEEIFTNEVALNQLFNILGVEQ